MIRMSEAEWAARQAGRSAKVRARIESASAGRVPAKKKGRRNLYGAQRVEIDGIEFDSQAEGKRYVQLKALEKAGEIVDLRIQVEFQLLPAQNKAGQKERPVKYVADFCYRDRNGVPVVEDVKSAPTKTREYIIKRKLMLWIHGVAIREVMMP